MSIITDFEEAAKLDRARVQPNIHFLPFSATEMLDEVRKTLFSDVRHDVRLAFVSLGPLACIVYDDDSAVIYIHQLLNHSDTPPAVISHVVKHELLHLRIPSEIIDGKEKAHPPRFWEAEREISLERSDAWNWIWLNYDACLQRRPIKERIDVIGKWRAIWSQRRISLDELKRIHGVASLPPDEFM